MSFVIGARGYAHPTASQVSYTLMFQGSAAMMFCDNCKCRNGKNTVHKTVHKKGRVNPQRVYTPTLKVMGLHTHFESDGLTAFDVNQRAVRNGLNAAPIDTVADFDFGQTPRRQTDQGASI